MMRRYRIDIEIFEAAKIDRHGGLAIRGDAFGERVHAAFGAELMLDAVLVERIGLEVLGRRQEPHLIARRKPQQRSLALADRTVARHAGIDLAFDFESDLAAVAATLVLHRFLL